MSVLVGIGPAAIHRRDQVGLAVVPEHGMLKVLDAEAAASDNEAACPSGRKELKPDSTRGPTMD